MRGTLVSKFGWMVVLLALLVGLPGVARADEGAEAVADLFRAARSGDLAEIRSLVDAGADPDPEYKWGKTPLFVAAQYGHLDIVRYLLEKGADASVVQTFHGFSALESAVESERFDIAALLVAAGADGREDALEVAIEKGALDLARAAVESGPLYVSRWEALATRLAERDETWSSLAESVQTRPDPPPPKLDEEQIARLVGEWEARTDDRMLVVWAENGDLHASFAGNRDSSWGLRPVAKNRFEADEGRIDVVFWGRAGSIEGVVWEAEGEEAISMRRNVAEVDPEGGSREAYARASLSEGADPDGHWPSFRGRDAAGVGDGTPPVDWDLASGRNVLWTVDVPGYANSSPIVWGDRVFVTTAAGEGLEAELETGLTGSGREIEDEVKVEHRWLVVAVDKQTGERLWETEVGRALPASRRHFKASQASATPVTDGRRVVAVFPTVGMACLDAATGKILWKRDLGPLPAGTFSDPTVEWGFAGSPILWNDQVILQADVHGSPWIGAFSLETGEPLWRRERDVAPSWSTPTVVEGPEGPELVVNASTIRAYDPATGADLWSLGPTSELVITTPIAGDGVVYVTSGYAPSKPIYAVRPGIRGDFEVEPGKPHAALAWSHARGGAYMPTPLRYRGRFWIVHHNARLVAYDLETGKAVHKARFSKGGTFTASPVAAAGRIYTGTEEGLLYVLDAGEEPTEITVHDFGEPIMATPAISEGILLVRTPKRLIALAGEGDSAAR